MLPSRASIALNRLKEIDQKYKLLQLKSETKEINEEKNNEPTEGGSSISSLSDTRSRSKEFDSGPKVKLNVQMPTFVWEKRDEEDSDESVKVTRESKSSVSSGSSEVQSAVEIEKSKETLSDESVAIRTESSKEKSIHSHEKERRLTVIDSITSEKSETVHENISEDILGVSRGRTKTSNGTRGSLLDSEEAYASDTFEDASDSSSKVEGRGTEEKDPQIIHLVAPKLMQSTSEFEIGLDEDLFKYVEAAENLKENSDLEEPVILSEESKSEKSKSNRKYSNGSNRSQSKSLSSSHAKTTKAWKVEKTLSAEEHGETVKSNGDEEKEKNLEKKEESLSREASESSEERLADAITDLRRLNKQAIDAIVRHRRPKTTTFESKVRSKQNTDNTIPEPMQKQKQKIKRESEVFLGRHSRKRGTGNKSQQKRRDIRAFLTELDHLRSLDYDKVQYRPSTIKPLELPWAMNYRSGSPEDITNFQSLNSVERIRESLSEIRHWLKEEYLLYREYSALAQTLNANYVPATLEDAKEMIRELQTTRKRLRHRS